MKKKAPAVKAAKSDKVDLTWPTLAPAALQGLAGRIVKAIAPHTEADPVAVLAHLLTAFGNVIGRGPHFMVEATRHGLNLFTTLVGKTSRARKGQAWSTLGRLFSLADRRWTKKQVVYGGLSSGEGLIYAVRDKRVEKEPQRHHDGKVRYVPIVKDQGVTDKRLLVIEEELARPLKVTRQDGNILSPLLRQAWDRGDLRSLTKNSPMKATGAHISVVGHITKPELAKTLSQTEQANGFANRFLWVLVRRSKLIASPQGLPNKDFQRIAKELRKAVKFARKVKAIPLSYWARRLWEKQYQDISRDIPGMVGAILARAEAQIPRLARLYALLNSSKRVKEKHLKAALAFWEYCEQSAELVFTGQLGDPLAHRIYAALQERQKMTETEIHRLVSGHKSKSEIRAALAVLKKRGLIRAKRKGTKGRTRTTWRTA